MTTNEELRESLASILISYENLLDNVLYANYSANELNRDLAEVRFFIDNIESIVFMLPNGVKP